MTAASIATDTAPARRPKYGSMSRDRRWALRWSYFFLILFAIFFLMPPVYMLITSLKTSAEISAATNPWWVNNPTLGNYIELLTSNQYLTFFRNSALVSVIVVGVTMLISVPAAFALSRLLTSQLYGVQPGDPLTLIACVLATALMVALAARDQAPYKTVITHGWTVDGEGKAMHKSTGNAIPSDEVVSKQGAEILRLWVASSDYQEDVRVSPEILAEVHQHL